MKRLMAILLASATCFMVGCSSTQSTTAPTTQSETETQIAQSETATQTNSNSKVLTVYFEWAGNLPDNTELNDKSVDAITSASIVDNNYHIVADYVQELTDGDVFEIKTDKKYPTEYGETVDIASDEKKNNERPSLSSSIDNIADYDTIVLVYPNWWGTYPMAVANFLDQYDLSGKTVLPICTHEGSGMGDSEDDLKAKLTNSTVKEGLSIRAKNVPESKDTIKEWLVENGVL